MIRYRGGVTIWRQLIDHPMTELFVLGRALTVSVVQCLLYPD